MRDAPTTIPLAVLDDGPVRPSHALGPRSLDSVRMLRVSVTDRCNLRCGYCMPQDGVAFEDRSEHLSSDQIDMVARQAHRIGVRHFKLTGGEPTVRSDLEEIVGRLARLPGVDLSMTTNGTRLARRAASLRDAGLDRVTISLDSLDEDRFASMTGGGRLEVVLRGLDAAQGGFSSVKINTVVIRGRNDSELGDFVRLAMSADITVRFIEFMPIGDSVCAGHSDQAAVMVPADEMFARLEAEFGSFRKTAGGHEPGVGPAEVYDCPGGRGRIGFIHAMSKPFCDQCNRLRLTANGVLRSCLFDGGEIDLRPLFGETVSETAWTEAFASCTALKPSTHGARGATAMSSIGG